MALDVNLNTNEQLVGECVKATTYWGETLYSNICNGNAVMLPWGVMDYLGHGILAGAAIGLMLVIAFLALLCLVLCLIKMNEYYKEQSYDRRMREQREQRDREREKRDSGRETVSTK